MPKVSNKRVRFLEAAELARLMKALSDEMRAIATFCRFTGCRRGEALNLKWNDCDMKRGIVTLPDTKTGPDQSVKMNGTVRALLESLPSPIDRAQYVFPGYHNAPNGETWLIQFSREWKRACKAAGITNFHFHDLRHDGATALISAGATLYDVQGFLRHRTPAMSARYAHLTDDRREATTRLLDAAGRQEKGTQEGTR
jgi:integrase